MNELVENVKKCLSQIQPWGTGLTLKDLLILILYHYPKVVKDKQTKGHQNNFILLHVKIKKRPVR